MKRKGDEFNREQYDARPCNYCNAYPGCTNTKCILFNAYKLGQNVPRSLIEKFNAVRVK